MGSDWVLIGLPPPKRDEASRAAMSSFHLVVRVPRTKLTEHKHGMQATTKARHSEYERNQVHSLFFIKPSKKSSYVTNGHAIDIQHKKSDPFRPLCISSPTSLSILPMKTMFSTILRIYYPLYPSSISGKSPSSLAPQSVNPPRVLSLLGKSSEPFPKLDPNSQISPFSPYSPSRLQNMTQDTPTSYIPGSSPPARHA